MNGDILTKVAFGSLLDFHTEHAQRRHDVRARLHAAGALRRDRGRRPSALRDRGEAGASLPRQCRDLRAGAGRQSSWCRAARLRHADAVRGHRAQADCSASVFPIREYWLDIGRIDDFNKANDDYIREFREFEATAAAMIGDAIRSCADSGARRLERRAAQEHPAGRRQAADRLDDRGRARRRAISTG